MRNICWQEENKKMSYKVKGKKKKNNKGIEKDVYGNEYIYRFKLFIWQPLTLPFLLIMLAMLALHRQSSWSCKSATFEAPEEGCFRQWLHYASLWRSFLSQLGSGVTTDICPRLLQLQGWMSSHYIYIYWFCASCLPITPQNNACVGIPFLLIPLGVKIHYPNE